MVKSFDERPVFIIKLTDFDPPKYVYTSNTFIHSVDGAKKFRSRSYTNRYIKTHGGLAGKRLEIVKVNDDVQTAEQGDQEPI